MAAKRSITKVSIIIPAYNEERTIEMLLQKVIDVTIPVQKEIIIVDDGSKDHTAELVRGFMEKHNEYDMVLLRKRNGGKGSAIREGFKRATGDVYIVQDADLEYDPRDYARLLRCFEQNDADVVYGSRILEQRKKTRRLILRGKHHHSSIMAYIGGRVITIATNILFGSRLSDEPTCYKAYRADLGSLLQFSNDRFGWEPEITAKLLKQGIKIFEVPIRYYPRSRIDGKKIGWMDAAEALGILLMERLR
ncbi:MAG: glycosyltransferase family 2 protein [Nanoarchaeota archaeon]